MNFPSNLKLVFHLCLCAFIALIQSCEFDSSVTTSSDLSTTSLKEFSGSLPDTKLTRENDLDIMPNDSVIDSLLLNIQFEKTITCYTSKKLEALLNAPEKRKLSEEEFEHLSIKEHFTHSFNYPESYYQSCAMFMPQKDLFQKIPANLPPKGEGFDMSQRQEEVLSAYRDSIIFLMKECIKSSSAVSMDFKRRIVSLQAYELIPTLIQLNSETKPRDPYILTTLCLIMKNESEEFRQSSFFQDMYQMSADKPELRYIERSVPFDLQTQEFILSTAQKFHDSKLLSPSEFVSIPEGIHKIGSDGNKMNPLREINIRGFDISKYEITNRQFERFISETAYITTAEAKKDALVFRLGMKEFEWAEDTTAYWRFPNGISKGGIEDKMDHPVTCISYDDAQTYCWWANVKLPTLEQWEVACRGGSSSHYFFPNNESIHDYANIWYGINHLNEDSNEDYTTTAPVGSYKPNPFGLYDIYGNVFEFCSSTPDSFKDKWTVCATRGGSWWCSEASCSAFNSEEIGRVQRKASFSNNGFRVVR